LRRSRRLDDIEHPPPFSKEEEEEDDDDDDSFEPPQDRLEGFVVFSRAHKARS
jgi:hypothetical protein